MRMNNRIVYLDNVCGLLIAHMIYTYHIAYACSMSENRYIEFVNNLLFFFMAWFFFKGGMTFRKKATKEICKISVKRLLVPYVCFCLLGFVIDFTMKYFSSNFPGFLSFIRDEAYVFLTTAVFWPIGASWFLLALFIVRNLYNFLHGKMSVWLIALICLTLSFIVTYANNIVPCYISNIFHGMTLFCLGDLMRRSQFDKYVFFLSVCVFTVGFYFPSKIDFRDNSVICGYFPMAVAYEIAGCIVVNNIFSRWLNKKIVLLTYIGNNSMVFYLIHFPVMYVTIHCLSQVFNINDMTVMFTVTSMIVTISMIVADIIFRHGRLKFIVGG